MLLTDVPHGAILGVIAGYLSEMLSTPQNFQLLMDE